jgi:peptide/nickel transport system substrate-binding protein
VARSRHRLARASIWTGAFTCAAALLAGACGSGTDNASGNAPTTQADANAPANGGTGVFGGASTKRQDFAVPSTGQPKVGGKLIYALEAESDGLNPAANRFAVSGYMEGYAVYDALAAWNDGLVIKPYLAEAITPDPGYLAWTIKLRPNIKFHDGSPLTADVVKKNFDAIKASALTGSAMAPLSKVEVADELTARVFMSTPWVVFPAVLTTQVGFVASAATATDPAAGRAPVGTGPFVFDEWQPDARLRMKKNPNYWRPGLPYLDSVEFRPTPDNDSRLNGLAAKDFNMTHTSEITTLNSLTEDAKDGKIQLWHDNGESEESGILINVTKPPLNDVRIRQAMAHAIDRQQFGQVTETPMDNMAEGMFTPSSKWYTKTDYPKYDPEKAKQLVAEYVKEKGPVAFNLASTTSTSVQRAAQYLAEAWKGAGMDVKLDTVQQTTLITNALTGNYQAALWRQFGAQDPDGDYVWFTGKNADGAIALNMARNKDPLLDAALDKGRTNPEDAIRKQGYEELQRRQTADLPYLWLAHVQWGIAADLSVRGVISQTMPDGSKSAGIISGVHRLTEVWLDR